MGVVATLLSLSQTVTGEEITVLTFNHGDSVSLRWAPATEALFQKSVESGYLVQRRKTVESQWTTISPKLKPITKAKFESLADVNPDAAVLVEILYPSADRSAEETAGGSPYEPKLESVPGETSFEDGLLYAMALFSCDISIDVAKAAALHFVDKTVEKSATYQYRVVFPEDEKSAGADVKPATVDMSRLTVLPAPSDFEGSFDERHAQFDWSTEKHVGYYSAYNVERSTDGVHFTELRERPFVQAYTSEEMANTGLFRDTFQEDDETTYYYRLKGYSPFGVYGPVSNVVKGEPKFNFDKLPIAVDTVILNKKNEEVRWTFDKKYERKIKGFRISRTSDYKSFSYENSELVSPSKRSYKTARRYDRTQYYAVIAVGKDDTESKRQEKQSSYYLSFRPDTIPPAVPTGLRAEVDSAGVVTVEWNRNEEVDMLGYQLYFSNSGNEDDYYNLTDTVYPQTKYTYEIPLNTLTNSVYYRVVAIDKSYHRSQWTDAVRLAKPDTVAPAPIVFDLLRQPEGKVVVGWENSPSEDVSHMELYRQIDDTGKVIMLKRYDLTKRRAETSFDDSYEFKGEIVQYFMNIYDAAGNETRVHTEKFQTKGTRPGCIGGLKVSVTNTEDKKQARLTWKITSDTEIKRYVIYRKKDDEPMLDIASVRGNALYYEDSRLAVGSVYKYIVRPISEERTCPAVYSESVEFQGSLK